MENINVRRVEFLNDLSIGTFFHVPVRVLDLVASRKMPLAKFKLLALLLKNNADFHVKYQYLEDRAESKSIKKYIPELIEDGYIHVEKDKAGRLHHDINPIHFWKPLQHIQFDDLENYEGRFRIGGRTDTFRINDMDHEATRGVPCLPLLADLIESWSKGQIGNGALRLLLAVMRVPPTEHVTRKYLNECGFDNRTIKNARMELEQGGYISMETDQSRRNIWHVLPVKNWHSFRHRLRNARFSG